MRKITLFFPIMLFSIMVCFSQAPPDVSGVTSICSGSGTSLTATGEAGATFAWYDAETGGNLLASTAELTTGSLSTDIHFYVEQTVMGTTSLRTDALVSVTPLPSPLSPINTIATHTTICVGESTNLSANVDSANYQTVHWYDAPTGGNLLGTSVTGAAFTVSPTSTSNYYSQSEVKVLAQIFNYTGGVQTFTIPAGITSIEIDAYGARGGNTYSTSGPGLGGRVQAIMAVTPGQVFNIYVGGRGGEYAGFSGILAGGWNGGARGSNHGQGGGGGGATDIRINGTTLSDRILVAGGGGGKGPACTGGGTNPHGGGLTGGSGTYCNSGPAEGTRGRGGTPTTGGRKGCWWSESYCGGDGTFGNGGVGGNYNGGGGGGGWYGGGGATDRADGGGGSSYADLILNNVIHTQGSNSDHGVLTISYFLAPNCANTTRQMVTVTVNPLPTVMTISDTFSCPGIGLNLVATGADTYLWTPGNLSGASVSADPATTTTYTVIGTITSTGCSSSDMVNVTVSDVVASGDVINCEGNSSTLTATGAVDYTWNPGALPGASITVTPATTTPYIVTGTDPSGCITTDTVLVTVNPLPNVLAPGDTLIAKGEAINLTANGADTYSWSPGSLSGQTISVSPPSSTTYTVTGTYSATGCTATDAVFVSVVELPIINGVTSIKRKETTALSASGPGGATFNWYDAETGGTLLATAPNYTTPPLLQNTILYVALDDGINTSPRIPVNLTAIDSTLVSAGAADPSICPNTSTDLGASLNGPGFINWYDAASGGSLLGTSQSGVGFPVSPTSTQTYYAEGETRETSLTFNYTGAVQTFTVPAGITSIKIDAYGARGGDTYSTSGPGLGGQVQATMNVTPGQVLHIFVGGQGGDYIGFGGALAGGWNGGARGSTWGEGAGGGGATDIRINGTTLSERILVAGGGGGKGPTCAVGGTKPHGGGLTGGSGTYCNSGPAEGTRGLGGTPTTGGRRGCWWGGSYCGGSGSFGNGGVGGDYRGGGGGGGWYGGSGGVDKADGGGGSSYAAGRLFQNLVHTQGVNNDNGSLIITYSKNSISQDRPSVTVTVEDLIAPVPDISTLPDAVGDAPVNVSAPNATDACEGNIVGTTTDPTTYEVMGTYTINWAYNDGNGNVSTQSQTVIVNTTLPVELSSFTAKCEGEKVKLQWTTDSEINSSHFEVQRSKDGLSWENFGRVKSIGDSRSAVTYAYVERSRIEYLLYRLQQVDLDGTISFSEIIAADCSNKGTSVKIFPNPTSGRLSIFLEGRETEIIDLQLVNDLGQVLAKRKLRLQNGWGKEEFSLENYPAGFYELRVLGESRAQSYRVIRIDE